MRATLLLSLLLLSGCAYEYQITRPAEFARHIGDKEDVVLQRDPVEYRWRTSDSRLVLRIYNPTDEPMTLVGDRSSVVDEGGQSHPFRTVTMAPHSFVKLILPPFRPQLEREGPSIGIGFGTRIGSARGRRYYEDDFAAFDQPRYFTVYDDDAYYWNWEHESDVRLTLVYQQGTRSLSHEFVIARQKKK
ncbi:MAG TPA: hypothetical protein VHD56_18460 [Tepidisphaeraceae bacterium]|nr:hypothetical protein [Tepidisphaeraceae bacterium]